jgi:hypothetical protein
MWSSIAQSEDPPGACIADRAQVEPALAGADIGDVAGPDRVQAAAVEDPLDQVRHWYSETPIAPPPTPSSKIDNRSLGRLNRMAVGNRSYPAPSTSATPGGFQLDP